MAATGLAQRFYWFVTRLVTIYRNLAMVHDFRPIFKSKHPHCKILGHQWNSWSQFHDPDFHRFHLKSSESHGIKGWPADLRVWILRG